MCQQVQPDVFPHVQGSKREATSGRHAEDEECPLRIGSPGPARSGGSD